MNQSLRAECERMLPVMTDQIAGEVGRVGLLAILAQQAPSLSMPGFERPEAWENVGNVYVQTLGHLPRQAILEAFRSWHRGELYSDPMRHTFFPKPVELLTLADRWMADMRVATYRAKKALEHVEASGVEWTAERKKAERQKMIEMGLLNPDGSLNFTMGAKAPPEPPKPTQSPQQVAERLRQAASDDIGDVI